MMEPQWNRGRTISSITSQQSFVLSFPLHPPFIFPLHPFISCRLFSFSVFPYFSPLWPLLFSPRLFPSSSLPYHLLFFDIIQLPSSFLYVTLFLVPSPRPFLPCSPFSFSSHPSPLPFIRFLLLVPFSFVTSHVFSFSPPLPRPTFLSHTASILPPFIFTSPPVFILLSSPPPASHLLPFSLSFHSASSCFHLFHSFQPFYLLIPPITSSLFFPLFLVPPLLLLPSDYIPPWAHTNHQCACVCVWRETRACSEKVKKDAKNHTNHISHTLSRTHRHTQKWQALMAFKPTEWATADITSRHKKSCCCKTSEKRTDASRLLKHNQPFTIIISARIN